MMKTYLIPVLIVLLAGAMLLAIPGSDSFRLRGAEVLDRIGNHEFIIDSVGMAIVQRDGALLVDLDDPQQFAAHHLPDAVNFPPEEWNVKEIRKFFREKGTCVLCAGDLSLACRAWVLFTQMGIDNLRVLQTGPAPAPGIDAPSFVFKPQAGGQGRILPEGD
jgi:hypothetical protein